MTKEEILKFIDWLEHNEMYICGHVFQKFLGTYELRKLHEDDRDNLIDDFIKYTKNKLGG